MDNVIEKAGQQLVTVTTENQEVVDKIQTALANQAVDSYDLDVQDLDDLKRKGITIAVGTAAVAGVAGVILNFKKIKKWFGDQKLKMQKFKSDVQKKVHEKEK